MHPIPIPDALTDPGGPYDVTGPNPVRRVVIGPPDGDPTGPIRPVEALAGVDPDVGPIITILVGLDPGDLERLAAMDQPAVWLSMLTPQIPPFSVEVADGQG